MSALDSIIEQLVGELGTSDGQGDGLEAHTLLLRLAAASGESSGADLAFVTQRFEISGRLFARYRGDGRRATPEPARDELHDLGVAVLARAILSDDEGNHGVALKRFNAYHKALRHRVPAWFERSPALGEALERRLQSLCERLPETVAGEPEGSTPLEQAPRERTEARISFCRLCKRMAIESRNPV